MKANGFFILLAVLALACSDPMHCDVEVSERRDFDKNVGLIHGPLLEKWRAEGWSCTLLYTLPVPQTDIMERHWSCSRCREYYDDESN